MNRHREAGNSSNFNSSQDCQSTVSTYSISDHLEHLTKELQSRGLVGYEDYPPLKPLVEEAKRIYKARRATEDIISIEGICTTPAWDILLDLFVASNDDKEISITSACIGAGCPATTALRWLKVLEEHGYVFRVADCADQRRMFVQISERGRESVALALQAYIGTESSPA